jgi:serine/arginine repetitive matrix protein 1
MRTWINKRICEYLGFEDDVLVEYIISELQTTDDKGPCAKKLQIYMTGFLEKNAGKFMLELWELLIDAQNSPNGIPSKILVERKEEV